MKKWFNKKRRHPSLVSDMDINERYFDSMIDNGVSGGIANTSPEYTSTASATAGPGLQINLRQSPRIKNAGSHITGVSVNRPSPKGITPVTTGKTLDLTQNKTAKDNSPSPHVLDLSS